MSLHVSRAALSAAAVLFVALGASSRAGACDSDMQCKGTRVCIDHVCTAPPPPPAKKSCKADTDCPGSQVCEADECLDPDAPKAAAKGASTTTTAATPEPAAAAEPEVDGTARYYRSPPARTASYSPPAAKPHSTWGTPTNSSSSLFGMSAPTDRPWLVNIDAWQLAYPFVFSDANTDGFIINPVLLIERAMASDWSVFLAPSFALMSWSQGTLFSLGIKGGGRYYFDGTVLQGFWAGGRAGFGIQIVGPGSFGVDVTAEGGYNFQWDNFSLSLGVVGGLNIPLYSEVGDESGGVNPSGLSHTSVAPIFGINVCPGIRF